MHDPYTPLGQLRRIRWAVRAALLLGVAASVAANVLHADPNIISQAISAWPPLALLLTVELTSRIPMHRPALAALRVFATVAIAGIAAWVSYWHMTGVVAKYGETGATPYLLPLSVDGLIVVASVSLVELAGRIRTVEEHRAAAKKAGEVPPPPPAPPAPVVLNLEDDATSSVAMRAMSDPTPVDVPAEPAALTAAGEYPSTPAGYAKLRAELPGLTQAECAQILGVGERTLRTATWKAALQDA